MKDILTVMKFTMKDMIQRKSFVISTLIILVLIVIGFNVPKIIKSIAGENLGENLLIVDANNVFEGQLELLKQADLGYNIQIEKVSYEEIKQKLADELIDSAIIIETQNNNVKVRYILKDITMMDEVPQDIITAINSLYTNIQINKLGLTPEELASINPNFEFSLEQTEEEVHGNIFIMMIMSMILFYAIYFCAFQVSSSITTEKTSKIMETLVTSTSPSILKN